MSKQTQVKTVDWFFPFLICEHMQMMGGKEVTDSSRTLGTRITLFLLTTIQEGYDRFEL